MKDNIIHEPFSRQTLGDKPLLDTFTVRLNDSERSQLNEAKKDLDIKSSYAYSDHESDLPLLEWIGNPTVVSPTMKLREIAMERGWKIEEW